jgi:hypothetical protein
VVEHLLCKHEALSSNLIPTKTKTKKFVVTVPFLGSVYLLEWLTELREILYVSLSLWFIIKDITKETGE